MSVAIRSGAPYWRLTSELSGRATQNPINVKRLALRASVQGFVERIFDALLYQVVNFLQVPLQLLSI